MPSPCKGCGESVWWLRNNNTQTRAPIDVKSSINGNVAVIRAPMGTPVEYRVLSKVELMTFDGVRYMPHFATCTQASTFRRRDPKGRQSQ